MQHSSLSFALRAAAIVGLTAALAPAQAAPVERPVKRPVERVVAPLRAATPQQRLTATADGALTATGTIHEARFDSRGAAIRVLDGDGDARGQLRLRLAEWRRANGTRHPTARRNPTGLVDVASFEHAQVTERYHATGTGFEQSFVFAARPAGEGDLVLGIDVDGDLQAPACAPRHGPLVFARDGAPVLHYGSAIAFDGGGRQVEVATSYDGRGRIELRVAAAFVDAAEMPLVIDPAVGPTVSIGNPYYDDNSPAVAHDNVNGGFLVAWQRPLALGIQDIRARIYERDGTPRTNVFNVTNLRNASNPAVAFCSGRFLVVWDTVGSIRGAAIDPLTGSLDYTITIATPPIGAYTRRPSITGASAQIAIVAWDYQPVGASAPRKIQARAWINPANLLTPSLSTTWDLHSVSGGYVRDVRLPGSAQPYSQLWPSYLFELRTRAVWEASGGGILQQADVVSAAFEVRITGSFAGVPTLSLLDPVAGVPGGSSQFGDEGAPDIAVLNESQFYNNSGHCIVWQENGTIQAHRFDENGPIGSPFAVRASSQHAFAPSIGAGVSEWTVAYYEAASSTAANAVVRAARVLADGSVPTDDRPVEPTAHPVTGRPQVSSRGYFGPGLGYGTDGTLIVWTDDTGPASGPSEIHARRFEPVAPNEIRTGLPCAGPNGTTPTIATSNGPAYAGNDDYQLSVALAPPGALAALMISPASQSSIIPGAPGCVLELGLPLLAAMPAVVSPFGFATVGVPIPLGVPDGALLTFQWAVYTPGHNPFGWITSDAIELHYSQL
jgi:hypothetical protein